MPQSSQQKEYKYIVFKNIETMNTRDSRHGLNAQHCSWLENLQPIGANRLVSVSGPAPSPIATMTAPITRMFFASFIQSGGLATTTLADWFIVFTNDGAGHAVNIATGGVSNFAAAGTFSNFPDCTQWQNQRVLIADSKAGYCTYDNQTFVKAGGVSPYFVITNGGSGYGSAPTVTISGGSGSGATATAQITSGIVTSIILTNPGSNYQAADTLTVTFGSGSAAATAIVWPFFGVASTFLSPSITVTNGGHYYSTPPTVTISGGHGTGATAVATISGGAVIGITLTNAGTGWLPGDTPVVTIAAPPADVTATATANEQSGSITSMTLTNGGYGYLSTPTVTIAAGIGVRATAVATISGGSVVGLTITNVGSGYASNPATTISAPPAAVTATATALVSTGSGGGISSVAVFSGRVWLCSGRTLFYSGTGGYGDWNPANASGSSVIPDADLVHGITALRSLNNYLYIFGDKSVKQIGSITVSGSATLFQILTLSSDHGTTFQMTIQSYNRFVIFADTTGVYAMYGATVQKISDYMNNVFQSVNFTLDLQAAVGDINNIRCYQLLVSANNYAGTRESMLLTFMDKKWFVTSNTYTETALAGASAGNTRQIYESSGADVTQLFVTPTAPVNVVARYALADNDNPIMGKKPNRFGVMATSGVSATITVSTDSEQGSYSQTYAQPAGFFWEESISSMSGLLQGMTITGAVYGYTLYYSALEYVETGVMKSSNLTN